MIASVLLVCASLVYGEKDGYGDVSKASRFRKDNKVAEGAAFVADLRKRPRKDLTPVEIQAEDMAEFALYRKDPAKRDACVALLKKAHAAGPDTIWGWAALGYLDDFGAMGEVAAPKKDKYLFLGDIAAGVIDFEPKRLAAKDKPDGKLAEKVAKLKAAEAAKLPKGVPEPDALKKGAAVRKALLRTHLIELCGEKAVADVLSKQDGDALFARLWDDDATLEAFLLSGPAFDPPRALETLMTLFLNDEKGWASTEEGRKITVATALNVRPLGKKDDPDAIFLNRLRCYAAYRRLSQRKLFHETAAKRDAREWRFIVRDPTDAASILYLNSRPFNYKRPGGIIYTVPYRHDNCFGESIFGRDYYTPWRHADWPYWYKVHRVGGICNRQSTYGAVCANAHGLMAERAGQPNHCAWLLRDEDGRWNIRNDINKFTAGVFMFWGRGYQYVQATERAFASREAWDRSELLRFAFRHAQAGGDTGKAADKLVRLSISACPYNLSAWRDYTDALKAQKADKAAWQQYLRVLTKATPEGRTATWDYVFEALEEMRKAGAAGDELLAEAVAAVMALPEPKQAIPEEMNFEGVVVKRAMKFFKDDRERQFAFLEAALEANWGTRHYFTQILRQGLDTFSKDEKMCARFFEAFGKIAKAHADGGEAMSGKGLDFRSLINTASVSRQRDAFQTLAALRNKLEPPPKGTPYPDRDFGGRLISGSGLLYTSGRVKGDAPQDYPRVIDASPMKAKRPYQIAMKPPEDPWAVVELRGQCKIAGVTVTGEKLLKLTVSVSEDGKDWKPLFADGDGEKGEVRADFAKSRPQAKYVRVGRAPNATTEPLRISKILVYGETLY